MNRSDRALQHQQKQRHDKKHRKLVWSPEKLSPCDFDSYSNPSLLSASTNVFTTNPIPATLPSSNHRSSPSNLLSNTKTFNDQFPPPTQHHQQVWKEQQHYITIPPSSSAPSIALHRKPSITIKYSKDENLSRNESNADQKSNNNNTNSSSNSHENFLINFNADQHQNLSPFNYDISSNFDIHHTQLSSSSPTSASLNLNLINQSHFDTQPPQQIVFHSNNPFLSDNFDDASSCDVVGGENFFNVDDSNDTELLFLPDDELTTSVTTKNEDEIETQLLKNKREKFSNASPTMAKFCLLVVSPPTNKLFHVSVEACKSKLYRFDFAVDKISYFIYANVWCFANFILLSSFFL